MPFHELAGEPSWPTQVEIWQCRVDDCAGAVGLAHEQVRTAERHEIERAIASPGRITQPESSAEVVDRLAGMPSIGCYLTQTRPRGGSSTTRTDDRGLDGAGPKTRQRTAL